MASGEHPHPPHVMPNLIIGFSPFSSTGRLQCHRPTAVGTPAGEGKMEFRVFRNLGCNCLIPMGLRSQLINGARVVVGPIFADMD